MYPTAPCPWTHSLNASSHSATGSVRMRTTNATTSASTATALTILTAADCSRARVRVAGVWSRLLVRHEYLAQRLQHEAERANAAENRSEEEAGHAARGDLDES